MDLARRHHIALVLLRVFLAAIMIIHGIARISAGGVTPFGEFLTTNGLPVGFYLAWTITVFEIVGGLALAFGYFAWVLAVLFALHLLVGIILVHAKEGWFVVGSGRNGVEYSVFLLVSFLLVAFSHYGIEPKRRSIRY